MVDAPQCPACGHVNAVDADACASCGEALPRTALRTGSSEPVRNPGGDARVRSEALATADEESESMVLRSVAERLRHDRAAAVAGTQRAAGPRPAHYAGFVIRLVAFVIDLAVLVAFTVPLTAAGLYGVKLGLLLSGTSIEFAQVDEAMSRLLALAWAAMALLYFTALHSYGGQTIGKAVVGIAVRRARDLARIGVFRSFLRALAYAPSAAVLFVGFLSVVLAPRKRAWHDYVAGTCVVHLAPEEV